MKKLCFGTYLNVICQARAAQVKKKDLLCAFMNFANCYTSEHRADDDNFLTHLKSGHDQVPADFSDAIRKMSADDVFSYFQCEIVPRIDKTKYKNVILAFKEIISEDTDILDDTNLGPVNGYSKLDILHKTTFSFVGLLTNLFIHCVTQVKNKEYRKNIKEITKEYVNSFDDKKDTIHINEEPITCVVPLTLSVNKKKFDAVFTEVSHLQSLTIPNPSAVKLYHLNVIDYAFELEMIATFIRSNIGRYVFSRAKRNEYDLNDTTENIVFDAVRNFQMAGLPLTSVQFAEIMIYSFLECSLDAPKIMSRFELENAAGVYKSKSSGIHLLAINDNGKEIHQLVFCGADMNANLNSAVDTAFEKLKEIKISASDEHQLVESTVLNGYFSKETTQALKEIIIPQKASASRPDTGFGVFLGYNVSVDGADNMTSTEYREALTKQLQKDITGCVPYIQAKIAALKLSHHSFYFYVLPLDDIEVNSTDILTKALGV